MTRCRTCGLVAIVTLAIALSAACREGESRQAGDIALDEPASSAQLAPVVNAPPAPTEPPASPASGQSSSGAALETVEDLLTPGATLLGIQSIVEQGKDGQPGRIVSVQRMRLGDAMVRGDWASQDLSRRDDPDDSVWEVEVANVVIGHSCDARAVQLGPSHPGDPRDHRRNDRPALS